MTTRKHTLKTDVYQTITDQLIELLENDHNWTRPWLAPDVVGNGLPINISGRHYNGINVALLWGMAQHKGFTQNLWGTFKQWKDVNANVSRGEKSTQVVWFKPFTKTDETTGEETTFCYAKSFRVFNVDQVAGYEIAPFEKPTDKPLIERLANAESVIKATRFDIRYKGSEAFYHRKLDYIQIPDIQDFIETENATAQENFYGTLFHECAHNSGSPDRLNRTKGKRFGDDAYSIEELVAEISSAFTCATLGITPEAKPETSAYIKHWLKGLKNDKKFFFSAASAAQKATDYIIKGESIKAEIKEAA